MIDPCARVRTFSMCVPVLFDLQRTSEVGRLLRPSRSKCQSSLSLEMTSDCQHETNVFPSTADIGATWKYIETKTKYYGVRKMDVKFRQSRLCPSFIAESRTSRTAVARNLFTPAYTPCTPKAGSSPKRWGRGFGRR